MGTQAMEATRQSDPVGHIGEGIYTIPRAAFIVRAKPGSVRRWVRGYKRHEARLAPLVDADYRSEAGTAAVSFLDLVELRLIERLTRMGVPLRRLREAHDYLRDQHGVAHPFAWEDLRTDGRDLFVSILERDSKNLVQASGRHRAHLVMPEVVEPFFKVVDFSPDTRLASRVFPFGQTGGIVIDAEISFGEPVVEESRIQTGTLAGFVRAGDDPATVARWFDIDEDAVRKALAFEAGEEWAA